MANIGLVSGVEIDAEPFPLYMSKAESDAVKDIQSTGFYSRIMSDIAATVFAENNRKIIVHGGAMSGKTWIIEQFIRRANEYLKKSSFDSIFFVRLSDLDVDDFSSSAGVGPLRVTATCRKYKITEENLCFVTDNVELGLLVAEKFSDSAVVIETSTYIYESLVENFESHAVRTFDQWNNVSTSESVQTLVTSTTEIDKTLDETLSSWISRQNVKLEDFSYSMVGIFAAHKLQEYAAQIIEELDVPEEEGRFMFKDEDDEMYLRMPISLIAAMNKVMIKRFMFLDEPTNMSFNEFLSENLEDLAKIAAKFFQSGCIHTVFDHVYDESNGEGTVAANGSKTEISKDKTPVKFSDMSTLAKRLKKNIFGQDEAVDAIANDLLVSSVGLNDPQKPLRSMLFLGPTGVGKTQLAINLAKEVSEEEMNIVRIDMSEYQKSHEVAKLFGSPPGYVGHEEGGVLTKAILKHPKSIVILDEVEKAHPLVWDSFLQVLDAGRMTDSSGRVVDFSRTIIIMTSNIGVAESSKSSVGFGEKNIREEKEKTSIMMRQLSETMRPEFINRIDRIIVFKNITKDVALHIAKKEINVISERMKNSNGVEVSQPNEKILENILQKSDISKYGARDIQRTVFNSYSTPLAMYAVSNAGAQKEKSKKVYVKVGSNDNLVVVPLKQKKNMDPDQNGIPK